MPSLLQVVHDPSPILLYEHVKLYKHVKQQISVLVGELNLPLVLQAFLYKTVPQLCSTGPTAIISAPTQLADTTSNPFNSPMTSSQYSSYNTSFSAAAAAAGTCPAVQAGAAAAPAAPYSSTGGSSSAEASWPIIWQLVCGQLTSSSAIVSGHAGITVFPAAFTPLVKAAASCAALPAGFPASSGSGVLRFLQAACRRMQCGVIWGALLVVIRLLRLALFVAQVSCSKLQCTCCSCCWCRLGYCCCVSC
jgi:hypothetical protein